MTSDDLGGRINHLLPHVYEDDWADVLQRARLQPGAARKTRELSQRRRRRVGLAVGLAVFVVAIGTAFALGLRLIIVGQPAPPTVKQQASSLLGPVKKLLIPTVGRRSEAIVARTFAAGVAKTKVGAVYLWAAPTRSGGYCGLVEVVANDRNGKPALSGDCSILPGEKLWVSYRIIRITTHPQEPVFNLLYGRIGPVVSSVTARFSDGRSEVVPVHDHFFLAAVEASEVGVIVTARNRLGAVIATGRREDSQPVPPVQPQLLGNQQTLFALALPSGKKVRFIISSGIDVRTGQLSNCTDLVTPTRSVTNCGQPILRAAAITVSFHEISGAGKPTLLLLTHTDLAATSLQLRFKNGTAVVLALKDGYSLYLLPENTLVAGRVPTQLIARNARGEIVSERTLGPIVPIHAPD